MADPTLCTQRHLAVSRLRLPHHAFDTFRREPGNCPIFESMSCIQWCSIAAGIDIRGDAVLIRLFAASGDQHGPRPFTTVLRMRAKHIQVFPPYSSEHIDPISCK